MNIVNKLTLKHMRMNKRRTLVTIMGVIISAAMITAVTTLSLSYLDMMARDTIANRGLWHVEYPELNAAQLSSVQQDEDSKSVSVKRQVGWAMLENPTSAYRPYLYLQEYDDTALRNYHIELKEGRLPETNSELVLTERLMKSENNPYKVGDKLTLELGERMMDNGAEAASALKESSGVGGEEELALTPNIGIVLNSQTGKADEFLRPMGTRTYTVVGIIEAPPFEYSYMPGYLCLTHFDSQLFEAGGDSIGSQTADAFVELKHLNTGLYDHAYELAEKSGIESKLVFNSELLRYMGIVSDSGVRGMLYSLAAIIMTIIVVGSVSLIYNAFAISVSERFRHLGMLASVGATARQKRNSVFFEGFVIGIISIPIGMICGLLGIEITFRVINPILMNLMSVGVGLRAVLNPGALAAAALLSALTIFVSVYIPARRASRVSPIDAIRQTADVKLSRKAVKTNRLTAKLFGIEGNVALKNLKRNRRRYQATVFSLVISLVLFLTVSYFGESLQSSYQMTLEGVDYDTSVNISTLAQNADEMAERVRNASYAKTAVDVHEYAYDLPEDSGYDRTRIIALDDVSLRAYAEEAGLTGEAVDQLLDPQSNTAIFINKLVYKDEEAKKYITKELYKPENGMEWPIYQTVFGEGESDEERGLVQKQTLKAAGFTDVLPLGVSTAYEPDSPVFVVSQARGNELNTATGGTEGAAWSGHRAVYFVSSDPEKLFAELEGMDDANLYIYSLTEMHKQEEQMIFLMGVFVYGFITLITLICIANIFNTISTSIALRKREFAMLRSVGMTPGGFNRMIRYESIFYGLKALLYGLPVSFVCIYMLYRSYENSFDFPFRLPWGSIGVAVLAVFLIVFVTMLYSSSKMKKENIIDGLKEEIV